MQITLAMAHNHDFCSEHHGKSLIKEHLPPKYSLVNEPVLANRPATRDER